MENQPKKLISLEKHIDTYKLIIPAEVEKKIRHLCNKISHVEWSGTLFYTYSGSYEEGTLEIKCVDIFPMDIGSQAYTEFDMSPDVIAYMTDHPELLDCQMGLIHSHAVMATFFSNTDTSTLREEGNDRNHFVSLIVNNEGTYTAAITRKLKIKNIINSSYTYKTFDDIERTGTMTSETEEEVIAYNMLDIIKEGETINSFLEIDERLETIRKNKAKAPAKAQSFYEAPVFSSHYDFNKEYKFRQNTLFDSESIDSEPPRKVTSADPNEVDIIIPESTVKSTVLQLITGSIAIADASRIDPVKWSDQMVKLFDKRFESNMTVFNLWAEIMVEFVVANFVPDKYSYYEDEYISGLCQEVYSSLSKLPQNKYIKSIQSALTVWMK